VSLGQRFLLEGWPSPLTQRLSIASGPAQFVMTALIGAIECDLDRERGKGLFVAMDNGVYVNSSWLSKNWEYAVNNRADKPLSTTQTGRALAQISGEQTRRSLPGGDSSKRRVWRIEADDVLSYAAALGVGDPEDLEARMARTEEDVLAQWAGQRPESSLLATETGHPRMP